MLNLLNFFKKFKILLVQVWFVLQSIDICDSFLHKKTPFTLLKYFSSEFINIDWTLVSFTDWRKKKKSKALSVDCLKIVWINFTNIWCQLRASLTNSCQKVYFICWLFCTTSRIILVTRPHSATLKVPLVFRSGPWAINATQTLSHTILNIVNKIKLNEMISSTKFPTRIFSSTKNKMKIQLT